MAWSEVEELGIVVNDIFCSETKIKDHQCNRKLKIFREFVLATVTALVENKKGGKSSFITACDTFAASGIAGLQWKKHLKSQVHVSLANHDDLSRLKKNVDANSLTASEISLNTARVPGEQFPSQKEDEVHIYKAGTRALLSLEAFQFIFLNPPKNCQEYIDAAFHSVSNGGIVCLVVPDLNLFCRAPQVVRRQYAARIIKTDYWKELAARIVLGSMTFSAARCSKGIIPQYVVSLEDFILVCVKVVKGHTKSETSLNQVAQLLHCRFCQERVFMEMQMAPEENPYSRLPCKCKQSHLGKTGVLIGPMWKGAIFNCEFLCKLDQHGSDLKLSNNFFDVIRIVIKESFGIHHLKGHKTQRSDTSCQSTEEKNSSEKEIYNHEIFNQTGQADITEKDTKTVQNTDDKDFLDPPSSNQNKQENESMKRKLSGESHDDSCANKKIKKDADSEEEHKKDFGCQSVSVPFYYNMNKVKATTLPKLDKVVSLLQIAGYKASRTHFDSCAVRTNASNEQLLGILSTL